jgi:hypothetical protein
VNARRYCQSCTKVGTARIVIAAVVGHLKGKVPIRELIA